MILSLNGDYVLMGIATETPNKACETTVDINQPARLNSHRSFQELLIKRRYWNQLAWVRRQAFTGDTYTVVGNCGAAVIKFCFIFREKNHVCEIHTYSLSPDICSGHCEC